MNVLTYEQLKAQLDAVVAENVALKESVSEVRRQAFCGRRNSHNCGPFQHSDLCESIIESTKVETPTTSAALAEVEAKAIEKFAAQQEEKLKAAALIGATHLETAHEFAALQARVFAVELREGRV